MRVSATSRHPDGDFARSGTAADVYRIETGEASNGVAGGTEIEFGCQDALDQITAIATIRQSVESGNPVSL